ncbi:hypothetical protein O3G_MSEX008750 [Manduca sexta]|uniref:unspecific monooxygenase n=1 Tax=Manduca sexta TaxID=7130 RepID=A0A922CQB7_MANSE|nr:hypothetical protein O3G_MSEX008750 [Manduca sexta]KAG6454552.1 hypothetical protein O3G_MSEX008750 [Manduca sexta]
MLLRSFTHSNVVMILNSFVFLLCCLLVWVWMKWLRVKSYWADRNVLYSPPHPVFGSLTFLQKENPAIWLKNLYKQFPVSYCGVWLFWRPCLVINSPDIARRILVKDSDNFRNRHISSGSSDPLGSLNIFTVNDPLWTSARKRLTTVFTAAKLRAFQSVALHKSKLLVERIAMDNKNGVRTDIRNIFTDFTTDVVGETVFGVSSNSIMNEEGPLRHITKELMTYSTYRGLSACCVFFIPELINVFRFKFFPKDLQDYLRSLFRLTVEQHGGYEKEVTSNRDLIDAILKMRQDAVKEGQEMSEDFLVAQASIFLQGGFDTSAVALTYIIYELAFAPEAQERLYEEIAKTKERIGDKDFDATTLSEMPYLNAVIKEAVRKYPAMAWLDRVASKSYEIDENLTIEPGTVVYINTMGIQNDPQYFPEPEEFKPERFLPENEDQITPYTFLAFGDGPRHCIGERFAYQTIRYALAHVIYNFKVKKIENSKRPSECSFEKKGMFLTPGETLFVIFVPRM